MKIKFKFKFKFKGNGEAFGKTMLNTSLGRKPVPRVAALTGNRFFLLKCNFTEIQKYLIKFFYN